MYKYDIMNDATVQQPKFPIFHFAHKAEYSIRCVVWTWTWCTLVLQHRHRCCFRSTLPPHGRLINSGITGFAYNKFAAYLFIYSY